MKVIRSQDRKGIVVANNICAIGLSPDKTGCIIASGPGSKTYTLGTYSTPERADGMLNLLFAWLAQDEAQVLEMWADDENLDQKRSFGK